MHSAVEITFMEILYSHVYFTYKNWGGGSHDYILHKYGQSKRVDT